MAAFGWRGALCAWLFLSLLPSAAAQVERVAPPAAEAAEPRTAQASGVAMLALRNAGAAQVRLRVPASLRDRAGGTPVNANWIRRQDSAAPTNAFYVLESGTTAILEARADLPRSGSFEGVVEVLSANDAVIASFPVSLTRLAPVPAELLQAPKPVRLTLPSFYSSLAEPARVQLVLRNTTVAALELGPVRIGRMATFAGAQELSAGILPPTVAHDCPASLEPQQDCAVSLVLPTGLASGRYEFDVAVLGAGGGQSVRVQQVDIRRSFLWAWLAVVIGATAGAFVEAWRSQGRGSVASRLAVAERRDRAEAIERAFRSAAAQAAARGLLQRLGALDSRLREGSTAMDPATFDDQLALLEDAVQADAEASALTLTARPLVAAFHAALIRALEDLGRGGATPQLEALKTACTTLRAELAALRGLHEVSREAAGALEAVTDDIRMFGDGVQLRRVEAGLATSLQAAWDPRPPPGSEPGVVDARRAALQAALQQFDGALHLLPGHLSQLAGGDAAARQEAAELSRVWPSLPRAARLARSAAFARAHEATLLARLPPVPAAVANVPAVPARPQPVPDGALLPQFGQLLRGPSHGATLAELLAYRTRLELGTNVVVVAALGMVGVLAFWADSPAWGSTTDLITALLAGMGTRLTIGTIAKPLT